MLLLSRSIKMYFFAKKVLTKKRRYGNIYERQREMEA